VIYINIERERKREREEKREGEREEVEKSFTLKVLFKLIKVNFFNF